MKRIASLLLAVCFLLALGACGSDTTPNTEVTPAADPSQSQVEPSGTESVPQDSEPDAADDTGKTLVVCFSATGNTKAVAEEIVRLTGAALYELIPDEPYTAEDLNYNDDNCRANREMNDASARPAISGESIDISGYDTVIIGYPIWWGTMPRIINTFLDTYDLSGKVVLPFCTSGGSGIAQSVSDIRSAVPNADVRDGLRASGAQDGGIENWLNQNNISGS